MKGFLRGILFSLALIAGSMLSNTECSAQEEYYPVVRKIQLPDGGFNCNKDYRGIKVMMVNRALFGDDFTAYSETTKEAVKKIQIENNLVVSGETDLETWLFLGYKESDWRDFGVFVPDVYTTPYSGRGEIIEAVLKTASKYCESETRYLKGSAGPPGTYADGVGFLLECLYSAGICPDVNTYDLVLSDCPEGFLGLDEDTKLFSEGSLENPQRGDVIFFENSSLGIYDKDSMMYYMSFDKAVYTEVSKGGQIKKIKRLFDGYKVSDDEKKDNAVTGANIPLCDDSLIIYDVCGDSIASGEGRVCALIKTTGEVLEFIDSANTLKVSSDQYFIMASGEKGKWLKDKVCIGDCITVSRDLLNVKKAGVVEADETALDTSQVIEHSVISGETVENEPGPFKRFFERIINFFRRK